MNFEQIGVVHSSITSPQNAPIQPKGAKGIKGQVEIFPSFTEGLRDLEGFSHIYLIYHFHLAARTELAVTPFMDTVERGVYATRSPLRPNHIGLSIVCLNSIEDNVLHVEDIDLVAGTPLLDIKPYIQAFDQINESSSGWMQADSSTVANKRSDDRFL